MDMNLSPEDLDFQQEVRDFLKANLPERLRHAADLTPGVFVDPDIGLEWQAILNARGWAAPHWPRGRWRAGLDAGAALYLRQGNAQLAGTPALAVLGLKAGRPDHLPLRHARAEGALPAQDPDRRGSLVPGLFRARLRLRPRQPQDPRGRATAAPTRSTAPKSGPPTPSTPTGCSRSSAPRPRAARSPAFRSC